MLHLAYMPGTSGRRVPHRICKVMCLILLVMSLAPSQGQRNLRPTIDISWIGPQLVPATFYKMMQWMLKGRQYNDCSEWPILLRTSSWILSSDKGFFLAQPFQPVSENCSNRAQFKRSLFFLPLLSKKKGLFLET